MPTFDVITPFRGPDGRDLRADDSAELTPRQARYLLLSGKIRPAGAAKAGRGKTKPAASPGPAAQKED